MPLYLTDFSRFGNSLATFDISFAQGDWSAHAAIAILRSRDVSRFSCSRKQAAQASSRFRFGSSAIAGPASGTGCEPNSRHESGRPHRVEEPADLELEAVGVARQRLRRSKHLRGRRSGFAGAALHVANIGDRKSVV